MPFCLSQVWQRALTYTRYVVRAAWLPLALTLLIVAQTHLFNYWLDILPNEYMVRRTASAAALGILLFGPALFFPQKSRHLFLALTTLLTATIFLVQFLYYSFSGGFLQPSAFLYSGQGFTLFDTIKTLISVRLLIFVAGPLFVIAAWILTRRGHLSELPPFTKAGKIAAAAIITLAVLAGNGYLFLRETMEGGFTYIYEYKRLFNANRLVSKVGIINFSVGNVIFLSTRADEATAADKDLVKTWLETQIAATAQATRTVSSTPNPQFGLARGRNLIIIQIESFENAVINEKINGREITPNLNQLAAEGLYFPNYYSPIGPGTTADGEFMTMTSLHALPDKVAFIEYARNRYTALPALLKNNGYHTYALHGDVPSFWNRANMYPALGYEQWFGRKDYTIPRNIGPYDLGDADFFAQSIPLLQKFTQPFMATLITLTSHSPYLMPSDLQTFPMPATSTLSPLHKDYVQSAHYVDTAIGEFIAQLKAARLYENSLIAIFGDHGSFTHIGRAFPKTHTPFPDLQDSQIPLILLAPGTKLRGVNFIPASHLDFYPTVAPLLGIAPPPTIFGQNLLVTKTPLVIHRNLISGTIKNLLSGTHAYQAAADGVFVHGTCLKLPEKTPLTVDACRALYENKEDLTRISDTLIKNNLLPL